MISRLLIIDDKEKDSFCLAMSKRIFKNKNYIYDGDNLAKILYLERPEFVFFNISKSVNGDNLMFNNKSFDVYSRLRVSIIYPLKLNFSGMSDIVIRALKFLKDMFQHKNNGKMQEALSRR